MACPYVSGANAGVASSAPAARSRSLSGTEASACHSAARRLPARLVKFASCRIFLLLNDPVFLISLKARDVPLSSRAVTTLSALPCHVSGYFFPITPDVFKKVLVRACERARLDNFHFHDLRHEATSRIAKRLDNILELSAVTGHKTVQMLKQYYHPRATDLALKLLSSSVQGR
ncbi:tyrosine-type recombinase/integrase [Mycetohabitans sp. B6]|nr:tyrosine-type recombinase/integrase [Mycetohabitans sp. B6]